MRRFVFAAFALTALAACQPADTSTEWQPIMDAYFEAWNTGDLSGLDAILAQDFMRQTNASTPPSIGLDSLRAGINAWRATYPDFHVNAEEVVYAGDRAMTRWVVTGTDQDLGTQTTASGMSIARMADGKMVEEHMCWDVLSWYQGLGYVLTPPSDSGQ